MMIIYDITYVMSTQTESRMVLNSLNAKTLRNKS